MAINKLSESLCCGCSACANICPKDAIKMIFNKEGFLEPSVGKKCIECGLCEKVCSVMNTSTEYVDNYDGIHAYAAKLNNLDIRKQSQSGGLFWALAEKMLSDGGVVYGAELQENFVTVHKKITTIEKLPKLQKSKYVQSDMNDVYLQIKDDLLKKKKVLFSGTPCQADGLKRFLTLSKADMTGLIVCSIVCHGIPSPGVFKDWIECLQSSEKSKLQSMQFRNVDQPWGKAKETYVFENGKVLNGNYYVGALFFGKKAVRMSCHECHFCKIPHPSDITIGDYWGIEEVNCDFKDDYGVSLVITNTPNGEKYFEAIKDQISYFQTTIEQARAKQPQLNNIPIPLYEAERNQFWKEYRKYGMKYIAQKYEFIEPTFKYRLQRKAKYFLSKLNKTGEDK